jgi:FAD/FMN-containing dehydrogenase
VDSSKSPARHKKTDPSPSRRGFLAGAAAVGGAAVGGAALGWTPIFRVAPASAQATAAAPPGFPASVPLYQQAYQNWSGMVVIEDAWTCAPASAADVVTLANWAKSQNYRLRAQGKGHGWSPLVLPAGNTGAGYVLVDTTQHLTAVSVSAGSPATVTAQPGVTMDTLVTDLAAAGYGLCAIPAPGDLTLGGVLAINGHGASLPGTGESRLAGQSYGSLSNLIVSLTAVVWDAQAGQYALKTFQRSDPDIRAFLVHLGRAFITSVTLQLSAAQNLRCQSLVTIPAGTLFAAPGSAGSSSFASHVGKTGRVEALWWPFTTTPWVKVWTLDASKPFLSRQVTSPYNYSFTSISATENAALVAAVTTLPSGTPALEVTQVGVVDAGLLVTLSGDIWGAWHNVLRYVPSTTEQVLQGGFSVITARASIQQVVSDFYSQYNSLLSSYKANGKYPMNGPVEVRCTGLDQPADSVVAGAKSPILSTIRPRPDHPEWDTAVWFDMATLPQTPGYAQFYADMESWAWGHYAGSYAAVRPEWSKAFASSASGPWTNATMLGSTIPASVSAGQAAGDDWNTAVSLLTSYDPYSVFSNPFLDTLLKPA